MKRDLYQEVTDRIIAALEKGTAPWIKPWRSTAGALGMPVNAKTKKAYRGINVLLLSIAAAEAGYPTDQWVTFKQALELGVPVRKGERSTRVVFFKRLEVNDDQADDQAGEQQRKVIPLLREYYVFNVAQLSGPVKGAEEVREPAVFAGDDELDAFLEATGANITHGAGEACYIPSRDAIRMPAREAFKSAPDYYATALHELTHWTGHESRCNRLGNIKRFGTESYAFEELVAEMGSAFLCAQFGIEGRLQHASYIASWLKVLKGDRRAIFTASSQAQRAVDFVRKLAGAGEAAEEVAA